MYLYWEQTVPHNYFEIGYSLYVADVVFRDFIDSFKNVGGAQTTTAKFCFQEEFFNQQPVKALHNRTRRFEPPSMVFCQYNGREFKIYDYANREPKTDCVNYGLLTRISEIKNNLVVDTGIVHKMFVITCKSMMIIMICGHMHQPFMAPPLLALICELREVDRVVLCYLGHRF